LRENVAASERKQISAISSGMGSLKGAIGGGVGGRIRTSYQYRTKQGRRCIGS